MIKHRSWIEAVSSQGKLYTGKEGLAFTLFKCAAGGVGMLLQDKLKYLYQTFLTNYLGQKDQPRKKLSAWHYIHTVPYLLKNCSFSLFVVICRGVNLWLYQISVLMQTSLHKNLTKPFWSLIWIYWTYHWLKMTNLLHNINESPTPPAAPPNFSFMSSIQIVPD